MWLAVSERENINHEIHHTLRVRNARKTRTRTTKSTEQPPGYQLPRVEVKIKSPTPCMCRKGGLLRRWAKHPDRWWFASVDNCPDAVALTKDSFGGPHTAVQTLKSKTGDSQFSVFFVIIQASIRSYQ